MGAGRNEAYEHCGQRADAATRLQPRQDRVALPETTNEVEEGSGGQGSPFFPRWHLLASISTGHTFTYFIWYKLLVPLWSISWQKAAASMAKASRSV